MKNTFNCVIHEGGGPLQVVEVADGDITLALTYLSINECRMLLWTQLLITI